MRRRGIGLMLVLFVLALTGGTATVLVAQVTRMARDRTDQRAETFARVLLDSGIAYAHTRHKRIAPTQPDGEFELHIDGLLPDPAQGRLTLKIQTGGMLRVRADVKYTRSHATRETLIPIGSTHSRSQDESVTKE